MKAHVFVLILVSSLSQAESHRTKVRVVSEPVLTISPDGEITDVKPGVSNEQMAMAHAKASEMRRQYAAAWRPDTRYTPMKLKLEELNERISAVPPVSEAPRTYSTPQTRDLNELLNDKAFWAKQLDSNYRFDANGN